MPIRLHFSHLEDATIPTSNKYVKRLGHVKRFVEDFVAQTSVCGQLGLAKSKGTG